MKKNKKIRSEIKKINKARKLVRRKYRKKRKGFTLIELLAVILILGIIALIAIPTVNSVVKQSRIGANETTANNLVTAAEEQCALAQLNGEDYEGLYDLSNLSSLVKGNNDIQGYYKVDSSCKIELIMQSNDLNNYCYKKTSDDDRVSYYEMTDGQSCILEQKSVTENSCFVYEENNGEITITGYTCGGIITGVDGDLENYDQGNITITSYTETDYMDVIIPSYIDGKPVTKIGMIAFAPIGLSESGEFVPDLSRPVMIKSVVIPSTVKEIDAGAFVYNILESVNISYGVEKIGYNAFAINNIESIYLPNSIYYVGDYAFAMNKKLKTIYLSNELKEIPAGFAVNSGISGKLIIPDSVEIIKSYAFADNKIETLKMGNNLKEIEIDGFIKNEISEIIFSDSLETIGQGVFYENKLTSLELGKNVKTIGTLAFFNNSITKLKLNDKLEKIESNAFAKNNISGELYLPNSLTTLGVSAFYNNKISGKLIIPNNIKELKSGVFSFNNIETLVLGENVTSIEYQAFRSNNITGTVVIPDKVTTIGEAAFAFNDIYKIVIGKSVKTLDVGAFRILIHKDENQNTHLTSVVNNSGQAFEWAWVFYWYHDSSRIFETGTFSQKDQVTTVITKD